MARNQPTKATKATATKTKATTKAAVSAPARVTKTKPTPKKNAPAPKAQPPFDKDLLEKTMKAKYAELEKAVTTDSNNGSEKHANMIIEMAQLLNDWQGEIFRVAIGPGNYLEEAFGTMASVGEWLDKLKGNEFNTRTEWNDFSKLDVCDVKDKAGKQIYTGRPDRIQTLMWRDLALKVIVADPDEDRFFQALLWECRDGRDGKTWDGESVGQLFCKDKEKVPHTNDAGYPIHDEWYAKDGRMQQAVHIMKVMRGLGFK